MVQGRVIFIYIFHSYISTKESWLKECVDSHDVEYHIIDRLIICQIALINY